MSYQRPCPCDHAYPVCSCFEGDTGRALLDRSRWLSCLAGWPAPRLDPVEVEAVLAMYGRPQPPPYLALPRIEPTVETAPSGCGCGRA